MVNDLTNDMKMGLTDVGRGVGRSRDMGRGNMRRAWRVAEMGGWDGDGLIHPIHVMLAVLVLSPV